MALNPVERRMALNPVERRMALLCEHWLAFRADPVPRLLVWQVPENALRLVECFVEVQKLDLPYASGDVFLLFKLPYEHGLQFARGLKDSLRGQFNASQADLQRQGLAADWDFDPAGTPDTPAGVAQALRAFGSRYHRHMGHLVLVLMPPALSDLQAYLDWLRALLDTGLPERLRVLLVDPLEQPRLGSLADGGDARVAVQRPAIDGMATAQDTFAQEGGTSPAAVFRNLMMGAVVLAEKGSADQVKARAADALAFARQQQWHDQEVALRILVAGALLKESRHAEALTVYTAARAAAQHTVQAAHPAGLKLLLQTWFGEAGVRLAAGDARAAAVCYDEAAVVAQRDANPILAIEAFRMAGWCLARAGDRDAALQRLACAVDLGASLKPEARAMTTLPVALVDALRTLDAPRVARMQQTKRRLQQALDGVRQRAEQRGAQLAAAQVPSALVIVDQERQQQAEAAATRAHAELDAAAQGAEADFIRTLARGRALLGADWLVDNDIALPPSPDEAAAP
ncbi:MAG: hypothetical protein V4795_14660 [Pseudomonadota bacterium]